jgi:hypothetical protein
MTNTDTDSRPAPDPWGDRPEPAPGPATPDPWEGQRFPWEEPEPEAAVPDPWDALTPTPASLSASDDASQHIDWEGIRQANPLLDAVSATLGKQVRNGQLIRCIWPANHKNGDAHPSMAAYDDHLYCLPERRRGDVIDYVAATRGISLVEAARELSKGRVPTTTAPPARKPAEPPRVTVPPERLRAMFAEAWRYYCLDGNLAGRDGEPIKSPHARAVEYLALRGVDVAVLEARAGRPLVGHTPRATAGLVDQLCRKGFSADEVVAAGLAIETPRGAMDILRHRVVFPLRDDQDNVVGFTGRRDLRPDRDDMSEAEAEEQAAERGTKLPPRYLRVGEPGLYWPLGRPEGAKVVVVEGPVDALAVALGSRQAVPVAVLGAGLSQERWAEIAASKPEKALLGLDSDKAGDQKSLLAGAKAAGIGKVFTVSWVPVPGSSAKDPADVIHLYGRAAVLARLQSAKWPLAPLPAVKQSADEGLKEGPVPPRRDPKTGLLIPSTYTLSGPSRFPDMPDLDEVLFL